MSTITVAPPAGTTEEPAGPAPLTLQDRCDRCGAQAWFRATISGFDLLFCGHHAKAHLPKLVTLTSAQLHSELDKLEATHGPNAIREAIAAEESAKS